MKITKETIAYASILGGAIGDTLGADIEFYSRGTIKDDRPLAVSERYGVTGAITDDTQMTLFTGEGISLADKSSDNSVVNEVKKSLLRWYKTQDFSPILGKFGLASDVRMNESRAPGNSCLTSLGGYQYGEFPVESKGCGTIMRVAPIALSFSDKSRIFNLAIKTSRITHDHPEGYIPAAIWAYMLNEAKQAKSFNELVEFKNLPSEKTNSPIVRRIMRNLQDIVRFRPQPNDIRKSIQDFGNGFQAESALYIAFAACAWGRGVEESYMFAVNHDGDSDTTGAIAGNMLGLMYPDEILKLKFEVECKDLMRKVVRGMI